MCITCFLLAHVFIALAYDALDVTKEEHFMTYVIYNKCNISCHRMFRAKLFSESCPNERNASIIDLS